MVFTVFHDAKEAPEAGQLHVVESFQDASRSRKSLGCQASRSAEMGIWAALCI